MDEVVIVSGSKGGYQHSFDNFSQNLATGLIGSINAFGSNLTLGAGRLSPDNLSNQNTRTSFIVGQMIRDLASVFAGEFEATVGAGFAFAGIIAAPETGGVSLDTTVEGGAIAIHGGSVMVEESILRRLEQKNIKFLVEDHDQDCEYLN